MNLLDYNQHKNRLLQMALCDRLEYEMNSMVVMRVTYQNINRRRLLRCRNRLAKLLMEACGFTI